MLQVAVAVLLVVPIIPLVARIALQPIADASVLVLLIASLALHFLLSGLGLLFFGPEGSRTAPLVGGAISLGGFAVSGQVLLMVGAAVVLSALFFLAFERTIAGKALRATAVNRIGARLVGIRPARTALLAYVCASLLGGLIGVLVAPVTTMYYDSGFLIGLKAFVAAIIGGLVSYPLTAIGAIAVGVVESFASFWSGALKDVIVFSLLIPVLLLRSFFSAARRGGGRGDRRMTAQARHRALVAVLVVAIALAPLGLGKFGISLLNDIGIGALVALGLVLLTGIGGATSFGQAAFVGIAAYATAWLTTAHGASPWLGLLFALGLTGLAALAIGLLTLRLGGHFLPLSAPSPGGCRSRSCSATSMRSAGTPAWRTCRR